MLRKAKKRISDEIQMLKNLKHPKIIAFINAWTNKEQEKATFHLPLFPRIRSWSTLAQLGPQTLPLNPKP